MSFIVVGGVAGCGKSTIGQLLAQKLRYLYFDGDDYHTEESKEKMSKGIGLTGE